MRPTVGNDLNEGMNATWVSGSYEPPGQLVPPDERKPPMNPSSLLTTGGVKIGPSLYFARLFTACARSSGVKSISAVSVTPCRSYAGGFVGYGWVGEYHSPGTSPFGAGRSSIGHTGWPLV